MPASKQIYLDYQAATPLDARVKKAMEPYWEQLFTNPHAISYPAAIEAARAIDKARQQIARSINADSASIVFTSGATEANNLAILGAARAAVATRSKRNKLITLASEHPSVLQPIKALAAEGFEVVVLPVQRSGLVDLDKFKASVDESVLLVSAMHVNNETGVVQPLAEIAKICRGAGVLLHSDCAQTLGKLPLDVERLGLDLATLSSHKAYGPKGVGALYVRLKPKVRLAPIMYGGGQQFGLRPGTLPTPLCIGFGSACALAAREIKKDMRRVAALAEELIGAIRALCPEARLNGSPQMRAPGSFSLCLPGGLSEEYLRAFQRLQLSAGSACASTHSQPSSVLKAYGLSTAEAGASLRFGIGRFTSEDDVQVAIGIIKKGLARLGLLQKNYQKSSKKL